MAYRCARHVAVDPMNPTASHVRVSTYVLLPSPAAFCCRSMRSLEFLSCSRSTLGSCLEVIGGRARAIAGFAPPAVSFVQRMNRRPRQRRGESGFFCFEFAASSAGYRPRLTLFGRGWRQQIHRAHDIGGRGEMRVCSVPRLASVRGPSVRSVARARGDRAYDVMYSVWRGRAGEGRSNGTVFCWCRTLLCFFRVCLARL